jgi:GT2 family glycosyltransferase/spore maturation protein CgeB
MGHESLDSIKNVNNMAIQLHPDGTALSRANKALREKKYRDAISLYLEATEQSPNLAQSILENLRIAQERLKIASLAKTSKTVGVCGWELSHNSAGRVYTLAQLHQSNGNDVVILGAHLPGYGNGEIWAPIKNNDIPVLAIKANEPSDFIKSAIDLVKNNPLDLIHLSKPRINNILIGLLYKLIWGSTVLVDIDDEELTFVGEQTALSIDAFLKNLTVLPSLINFDNAQWTRLAVGLAKDFDGITVSGPALEKKYGGQVVRHARDETLIKVPASSRKTFRDKFQIPLDKKVVIFIGTPRNHKGLQEIGETVVALNDSAALFVIVGSFAPENQTLKQELLRVVGKQILLIEDQPFEYTPDFLSIADCYVIWQDIESPISQYQVPAKLSDALASGISILINETPAISDLIKHQAFELINKESFSNALRNVFTQVGNLTPNRERSTKLFLEEFSFLANKPRLQKAVELATTNSKGLSDNLTKLGHALGGLIDQLLPKTSLTTKLDAKKEKEGKQEQFNDGKNARLQSLNTVLIDWKKENKRIRNKQLISIIVPVYGQGELTKSCVESIFNNTEGEFELVLVDNGSDLATKQVISEIAKKYPKTIIQTNPENLQFALGSNIGFAKSSGEYLVFLNNDTEVRSGWLKPLIESLQLPGIVAAQPKLLYPDGSVQCIGIVFSNKSPLGYPIYSGLTPTKHWANLSRPYKAITAACMAMRANEFSAVNGFDPIYINGQEDVDLCLRLTKDGKKNCWYAADSTVIHKESQTPNRNLYTTQNRKIFADRWKGKVTADDVNYYKADHFEIQAYQSDRPSSEIGIYRPTLSALNDDSPPKFSKEKRGSLGKIQDGTWKIRGRMLEGSILCDQAREIILEVVADKKSLQSFSVSAFHNETTPFQYQLPSHLIDGKGHIIELLSKDEKRPLRNINSRHEEIFLKNIVYYVEAIEQGLVKGWAYDFNAPTKELVIELFDGRTKIGQQSTLINRSDVNSVHGISGLHGFEIPIPAKQFDGLVHSISLFINNEELVIESKKDFPKKLTSNLIYDNANRYIGAVEHVSSQSISGWALDKLKPEEPPELAIYVDGLYEVTVTANIFLKRFASLANFGYHGFHYEFPARLMNSSKRKVEVKVIANNEFLRFKEKNASSCDVFFPLIDFFSAYNKTQDVSNFISTIPNYPIKPPSDCSLEQTALLSIITLNWNGAHLLRQLLQSIKKHFDPSNIEVIVIDHNSSDESELVAQEYAKDFDVKWIKREKNYSFSESNNYAAKIAQGQNLFFVNNDIVFFDDIVTKLQAWLNQDNSIGVVGIQLLEPLPTFNSTWKLSPHHKGIDFSPKQSKSGTINYFPREISNENLIPTSAYEVPAVTAAALACRKIDFFKLGGFNENYFYGLEDVDFCLRLQTQLNKKIVCDISISAIHNKGYTRSSKLETIEANPIAQNRSSQFDNEALFLGKVKTSLQRSILSSLVEGESRLRLKPLRVVFVVTDASLSTYAGDFYTAMEMATALRNQYGWEVLFVKKDMGHIPGTDVLVVMRHDYDLRKIQELNPGAITIAWIRNRLNQWIASPFYQDYQILFCSSIFAVEQIQIQTSRQAHLLPIATNELRFFPLKESNVATTDIVFTGNFLGDERDGINYLENISHGASFSIYGHGWDQHPTLKKYWRGAVPYEELNSIYASAKIVIDDSHPVTREFNSLNSRVFDAVSAGSLVITNCVGGAKEVFGDALPVFNSPEELNSHLQFYLHNPEKRKEKIQELRAIVLEGHTYSGRATQFKKVLSLFTSTSLRFAIKVGIPGHENKETWGDWHFAVGIQKSLRKAGHFARIDILPEWYTPLAVSDDVTIVLQGLSIFRPDPAKINFLWLISHPDLAKTEELLPYEHIFVASIKFTEHLQKKLGKDKVSALLQCTDPEVFHPATERETKSEGILFVGNSRGTKRPVVDAAIAENIDIRIFGGKWKGIIDSKYLHGEYIPNDQLYAYYSNAEVVLNDHWEDMRVNGFISNRLFDAAACGSNIISDDIADLDQVFEGLIQRFTTSTDLKNKIDNGKNQDKSVYDKKLRKLIIKNHTFDLRINEVLKYVAIYNNLLIYK